jgi:hypothetical protein
VSREQASEFGEFVFGAIQRTVLELEDAHQSIVKEIADDEADRRRAGKEGMRYVYSTLINFDPNRPTAPVDEDGNREEPEPIFDSLESALASSSGHQRILYPRPADTEAREAKP